MTTRDDCPIAAYVWRSSLIVVAILTTTDRGTAEDRVQFNRDIRPILSDNCFACHGPDRNQRRAELRLDLRDEALAHQAFVPGDSERSALVERILSDDSEQIMPPPDSHKVLTDRQKKLLQRWIAEGAEYQAHWAFLPISKPEPPPVPEAGVPVRNPIDAFIQARLIHEGLPPSPEASREVLIRRVTLDLTGLPPTPAEVDAFLADHSEEAYEKVVDRLLQSHSYGERMAVDWLDAARYADSNGYQVDRNRELWAWRDWVIRAFNDNKPFDEFTIEQLAGDLLPNPTLEQRIATGFHRNHMMNEEGGIIPEEFLAEYTADRVETTAAVWMGQTFNCTRCHDHKFDPFTQRDFYSLKAFFHNVPERGAGDYGAPIRVNAPPFLKLPAPDIEAKIAELNRQLQGVQEQLAQFTRQSDVGLEEWAQRWSAGVVNWEAAAFLSVTEGEATLPVDSAANSVEVAPREASTQPIRIKVGLPAGRVEALRVECSTSAPEANIQWSEFAATGPQSLNLRPIVIGDSLAAAEATKLLDGKNDTRTTLSLKPDQSVQAGFAFQMPQVNESPIDLTFDIRIEATTAATTWRVSYTRSSWELLVPSAIQAVAHKEPAARTPEEQKQLAEFRRNQQPEYARLNGEIDAIKKQITAAEGEIPTTLVMEEMPAPRVTQVLLRGAYDKPGETVTAATPAVLPALADDLPRNRLGLAKWLVSPQNPLTARVTVNRFWQQAFSTGLVRTSEDFGSQGEPPSHPELLDWLAATFRDSGWDVKRLVKLIVTSATYRQQSHLTPVLRERDPDNRLLARGPRQRLMAEFIRDQALAASGLLVSKLGGPSLKPYHPPGLYEQVTSGSGYDVYVIGKGEDLYRRSLYTYWKRSVPHPAMLLFDAPFRETCTLRRPRSNTPLQALNLLNDPTYVEASRFLAQRMLLEGGEALDSRLSYGFRLLLTRSPCAHELDVLRVAYQRARSDFEQDKPAAQALLTVGEAKIHPDLNVVDAAAFTTVASILLNLDETITKN